jgi:hypothetical protein
LILPGHHLSRGRRPPRLDVPSSNPSTPPPRAQ